MNSTQKALVTLLSASIRGKEILGLDIDELNWNDVYEEADAHAVLPLIYPTVKKLSSTCEIPVELMSKWAKDTIMTGIYQTQHISQMKLVFKAFSEAGIPVVALKGLILRDLYPKPEFRTMSDSDLLIKKENIEAAEKVLVSLGYSKFSSIEHESCFTHDSALSIDLHWSLTNDEHLKNVGPFEDTLWKNLRTYDFHGVQIKALSLEYELMHLFIHIASHMIKSGFGVRQLCDIVVFVEHEGDSLNWDLIYGLAEICKLNKLISTILNLCHTLLDLEIPKDYRKVYPGSKEHITTLTMDIFDSGVYGNRNATRISSTKMLNHSLKANGSISKTILILRYLFPSTDKLDKRYSYARKYKFLLAFAWIHRLGYELFFNSVSRAKELLNIRSTSLLVKNKVELIEWLQI